MAVSSTYMGLTVWDLVTDYFNHTELESNWNKVDSHNHTAGKGIQIPSAGLENLAITTSKLNDGAVTNQKLGPDAVDSNKLADASVGTEHLNFELNWGQDTVTVSASDIGTTAISHGLSGAPTTVVVTPLSDQYSGSVTAVAASTFDGAVSHIDGTSTSTTVDVYWIAIKT